MKKRILICVVIVIAVLCGGAAILGPIAGQDVRATNAELTVNGKQLEEPAVIYRYSLSCLADFPFFPTLEALGCEIERDAMNEESDAIIKHAGRTVYFKAQDSEFSVDGERILKDTWISPSRVAGISGMLYMAYYDYVDVLHALGFEQITLEINETRRTVKLTALK